MTPSKTATTTSRCIDAHSVCLLVKHVRAGSVDNPTSSERLSSACPCGCTQKVAVHRCMHVSMLGFYSDSSLLARASFRLVLDRSSIGLDAGAGDRRPDETRRRAVPSFILTGARRAASARAPRPPRGGAAPAATRHAQHALCAPYSLRDGHRSAGRRRRALRDPGLLRAQNGRTIMPGASPHRTRGFPWHTGPHEKT